MRAKESGALRRSGLCENAVQNAAVERGKLLVAPGFKLKQFIREHVAQGFAQLFFEEDLIEANF